MRLTGSVLRVPELPTGWLCAECLRTPGLTAVFPRTYLQPWIGSQAGRRRLRSAEQAQEDRRVGSRVAPFVIPPFAGMDRTGRRVERLTPVAGLHHRGQHIDRAELRAWASGNGIDVRQKGRVKLEVLESFLRAKGR